MVLYFLTHQFKHVSGARKNRLIETVLLSTRNIFLRKKIALLSGELMNCPHIPYIQHRRMHPSLEMENISMADI